MTEIQSRWQQLQQRLAAGHATLLGPAYGLARMAHDAGTIGYEILTQLGQRPKRRFKGGQKGQTGA